MPPTELQGARRAPSPIAKATAGAAGHRRWIQQAGTWMICRCGAASARQVTDPRAMRELMVTPKHRPEIQPVLPEFLGTRAARTEFSRRHAVALGDRAATAAGIPAIPATSASDSPIMAWSGPRERGSDSADRWGRTENFLAPSGAEFRCEPLAIAASS